MPISVKVAIAVGAASGAAIAAIRNKEKILETAELILQKGADFCRHKLDETKYMNGAFASDYADGRFYEVYDEKSGARTTGYSETDEATTPDTSDVSEDEFVADTVSLD